MPRDLARTSRRLAALSGLAALLLACDVPITMTPLELPSRLSAAHSTETHRFRLENGDAVCINDRLALVRFDLAVTSLVEAAHTGKLTLSASDSGYFFVDAEDDSFSASVDIELGVVAPGASDTGNTRVQVGWWGCDQLFSPGVLQWTPQLTPVGSSASLRILTYNTAFVSVTVDLPFPSPVDLTIRPNEYKFENTSVDERAHKIADAILRGDQDVVLLQEVFSEDARQILVNRLKGTYPNYVSKLAGTPPIPWPTVHHMWQEASFLPIPGIPGIGDHLVFPGDSGLMIFSRWPFMPLTGAAVPNDATCSASECEFKGRNTANPGNVLFPQEVAFEIFDQCGAFDCYASKGFGMVKVQTPSGPAYVGLTHLQADYLQDSEDWSAERLDQYVQMRKVITNSIPAAEIPVTPVYVAGDLNTPGENQGAGSGSEWFDVYDPQTSWHEFYHCGDDPTCQYPNGNRALLVDTWGFETSPLDLGITNPSDKKRLDYILRNKTSSRPCMQHVMVAWDIAENGSTWYSDHLPVRADLNARAQWCSPNQEAAANYAPKEIVFPSMNCDFDPNTSAPPCQQDIGFGSWNGARLVNAGSFQWYRIDQAGSYSIAIWPEVGGENVRFDVYQGEDLSRPVEPFEDEPTPELGWPYDLLKPPYYIRVHAVDAQGKPDRSAKNRGYQINFHQHLCRDAQDACFLPAGEPEHYEHPFHWPENTVITQVNAAYFKFKTSGVREGRLSPDPVSYPNIRIRNEISPAWNDPCFAATIEEWSDAFPPTFVREIPFTGSETNPNQYFPGDWDMDGLPDRRFIAPDLDGTTLDELKTYYAVIERKDDFGCELPSGANVHYETDLGYFVPEHATCYAQFDDSGVGEDDHIRFKSFLDPGPNYPWFAYCDSHPCYEQAFDEPGGMGDLNPQKSLQGWFVEQAELYLYEDENGPDFSLGLQSGGAQPVDAYDPQVAKSQMIYADGPNGDEADYYYIVKYRLCREDRNCKP